MSDSKDDKIVEGVVDATLSKTNLEKLVENKNTLFLGLGFLGMVVLYKKKDIIRKKFNSLFSKKKN